jgi:putative endonuclease
MQYYVYVLQGANGHFYTGITTDVERRIEQHNGVKKGGAKYTRALRPYVLVHTEACASRSEALVREYKIKRMTHAEKALLTESKSALGATKKLKK